MIKIAVQKGVAVQTARKIYKYVLLNIFKMVWLFGHKKRFNKLKSEVYDSFNNVKRDFNKVGEWIKHLDDKHTGHESEIDNIKNQILDIQHDLIGIKDFISFFGPQMSKQLSKQNKTAVGKQPSSHPVQTAVQTAVQTDIFNSLTMMERTIVWAMINSDMKLSYEDIAALLGKDKSTIRGQINTIRQKNEEIIQESIEPNGKKRLYIPDDIRTKIIKSVKVKIKDKNPKSES